MRLGGGKEQQVEGLHDHGQGDRIGGACGTNGKKRYACYGVLVRKTERGMPLR